MNNRKYLDVNGRIRDKSLEEGCDPINKDIINAFNLHFGKLLEVSKLKSFGEGEGLRSLEAPANFPKVKIDLMHSSSKTRKQDFKKKEVIARLWGEWKYEGWKKSLSQSELLAFKNYTTNANLINEILRSYDGDISRFQEEDKNHEYGNQISDILSIDSALARSQLDQSIIVNRRVDLRHFFPHLSDKDLQETNENADRFEYALEVSKTRFIDTKALLTDHAFLSSSVTEDPQDFTQLWDFIGFYTPILLKIHLPKGFKGAYIGEISNFKTQNEFLIAWGQTFRYDSMTKTLKEGKVAWVVNVVPG